jgi:tRNA threonylcarbamoyl adenosine modification protein YjeE
MIRRHLPDDAATAALGTQLARLLRPGDLVLLEGDLGAGKTALARSVIRGLTSAPELEVPSPSYALVQPYEADGVHVLHADLYRIGSEAEIDELGLFDRAEAIILVEWPERAPSLADRADLVVRLAVPPGGAGREAEIRFSDARHLG